MKSLLHLGLAVAAVAAFAQDYNGPTVPKTNDNEKDSLKKIDKVLNDSRTNTNPLGVSILLSPIVQVSAQGDWNGTTVPKTNDNERDSLRRINKILNDSRTGTAPLQISGGGGSSITITGTPNQITVGGTAAAPVLSLPSTLVLSAADALISGSSVANGDLTIQSTNNATRTTSDLVLQPSGGGLYVGVTRAGVQSVTPVNSLMFLGQEEHRVETFFRVGGKTDYSDGLLAINPPAGEVIIGDVGITNSGTRIVINDNTASIDLEATNVSATGAFTAPAFLGNGLNSLGNNSLSIRAAGTGDLLLGAGGSTKWTLFANGNLVPSAASLWDFGTAATRIATGYFNTVNASVGVTTAGQLASTVATGTAPLSVASTTNVPNLNASSLNGATFANPGPIGTTPNTGNFTAVTGTSATFSGALSAGSFSFGNNALAIADPRTAPLPFFTLRKTIASLTGPSSGISGVTYNAVTGTLFIVRNVSGAAGTIYEITTDGTLIRTITNSNFIDTESVEWVGTIKGAGTGTVYDVLLVGEEDHTTAANESQITLCLLTRAATTLDRTAANGTDPDNVTVTTAYSGGTIANFGLEALCYDSRRSAVYYTAEKQTTASPNVTGTTQANIYTRSITWSASALSFGAESTLCSINALYTGATLTDISDMSYSIQDDTILIESDESDKCVKVDRAGTLIEQLATVGGQPEGVAISPDGMRLWVVGEAQEFYRYEIGGAIMTTNTPYQEPSGGTLALTGNQTVSGTLGVTGVTTISNNLSITNGGAITVSATTGNSIKTRSGGVASQTGVGIGRTVDELTLGVTANANEQFTGTVAGDYVVHGLTTGSLGWMGNTNALANPMRLSAINRVGHKVVTNGNAGTFTLVAGSASVANTSVTANSVIFVTLKTVGGTRAGNPDIVPSSGVGFTATGGASDTSTYNYIIQEVY